MADHIQTALGALIIRPATEADAEAFAAILRDAQAWLVEHGTAQWVPGVHEPNVIAQIIAGGTGYVVEHEGRVIATCRLTWELPAHWEHAYESIGYLGTLNVARKYMGYGIGVAVIRWAEAEMRARGKTDACLDCYASNAALSAYYERLGYQAFGEVETYPGYSERMFHKHL
jgi:protein-tyrosine phosphatase